MKHFLLPVTDWRLLPSLSPNIDLKSLTKRSFTQERLSLMALQPLRWSNLMSQNAAVMVVHLRTKRQIPVESMLGSSPLLIPLRMFHMNLWLPITNCPAIIPPQLWAYVFSHIFFSGSESTVLGSHSPFQTGRGNPLGIQYCFRHAHVCTACTSNSSSFTVSDTPQQGQMWFWAN